jgi:type I restriction enzyme, S subunit
VSAVLTVQEPSAKYLVNLQPPLVRSFDLIAQAPGGVARLRELILTLAVQGKLVPQDPNDEPASELLKKIRAEKDRLIAEGKIKRDKPLAEIEDEETPFELPAGWKWVRLNALLQKIGAGSTPLGGREVYVSTGVKFLRSQNVWNEGLRLEGVACIPPETHARMSGTVVVANDLLFNITGASIGRCAVVPSDFDEANVSQHVTILRTVTPALNAFLHKVLVSRHVQQTVMDVQVGVSREGLSIAKLGQFLIPVPPLAEQTRIVTRVEELMQVCDALEASGQLEAQQHAQLVNTLLGTLTQSETPEALADNWQRIATHFDVLLDRPEAVDALEQTILQLAVRGLLVPQDPTDEPASVLLQKIRTEKDHLIAQGKIKRDKPLPPITDEEKPFELPQGWEWARLGSLANFIDYRGKTPTKTTAGVPLITAKNVRQGFIKREPREFIAESAYEGWMTRGFPRVGDLLFTTEAPLGNVAAIDIHERFALAQRVICFGLYLPQISGTLCAFMQSSWMQEALSEQASGVTAQGIKSSRLQLMLVPVPPLAEQSRIVIRINELRVLCADLRQRLAAVQEVQSQLADALVMG